MRIFIFFSSNRICNKENSIWQMDFHRYFPIHEVSVTSFSSSSTSSYTLFPADACCLTKDKTHYYYYYYFYRALSFTQVLLSHSVPPTTPRPILIRFNSLTRQKSITIALLLMKARQEQQRRRRHQIK